MCIFVCVKVVGLRLMMSQQTLCLLHEKNSRNVFYKRFYTISGCIFACTLYNVLYWKSPYKHTYTHTDKNSKNELSKSDSLSKKASIKKRVRLNSRLPPIKNSACATTHLFSITLVDEGAIQLTLMSIWPCLLQMAMLNRPKLARIILILCPTPHASSNR